MQTYQVRTIITGAEGRHAHSGIEAEHWLMIPVRVPLGGEPRDTTHLVRDEADGQQRPAKQQQRLQKVRHDHRLQAPQGRVDDGDEAGHQDNHRDIPYIDSHHDRQRFGCQKDQQRHPKQPEHEKHRRGQQANADSHLRFQQLVGTDGPPLHVERENRVTDDQINKRQCKQAGRHYRTFSNRFARLGQVGDGAQQSDKERDSNEQGTHLPVADEVLRRGTLPTAKIPADGDRHRGIKADDDPIDNLQTGRVCRLRIHRGKSNRWVRVATDSRGLAPDKVLE